MVFLLRKHSLQLDLLILSRFFHTRLQPIKVAEVLKVKRAEMVDISAHCLKHELN